MNEIADIDQGLDMEDTLEGGNEIMSGIDEVLGSEVGTQDGKLPIEQEEPTEQGSQQGDAGAVADTAQKDEQQQQKKEDPSPEQQKQDGAKKDYPETIKSTKARHDFDQLRADRDKERERANGLDRRLKEIEGKLTAAQSKSGVNSPEVAALEKQIKDLNSRIEEQDRIISFKAVEETPDFKEKVTVPKKEANDDLDQLIETYKLDSTAVDRALFEPNKFRRGDMLDTIMEQMPEGKTTARAALKEAVDRWIAADKVEKEIRANAKGNQELADTRKREEEAASAIQRKREWDTETGKVEQILREKLPELFENDEKIWKSVLQNHNAVKDFDKLPARAKAFANMSSHAVMPLMRALREERMARQKAEKALADQAKAQPGAGSGRGTSSSASRQEDDIDEEGGGFMEHLGSQLNGANA
jgi:hypothetical protein